MPGSDGGKILILGGTAEGYRLAERLASLSANVTTSLAGRTQNPRRPAGQVRIGGFGGAEGLAGYLRQQDIRLVIDATHPFATHITANAMTATEKAGVPFLRLERPLWREQTGDRWIEAATLQEAAVAIPERARVFLAIGRQHLAAFSHRDDASFVARMIEPPETALPFRALQVVLGRPGTPDDEAAFMSKHGIGCLVCRNSGGGASYGKIIAARQMALPVIVISRGQQVSAPLASSLEEVIFFINNHGLI